MMPSVLFQDLKPRAAAAARVLRSSASIELRT